MVISQKYVIISVEFQFNRKDRQENAKNAGILKSEPFFALFAPTLGALGG
jgi:hypothetical protein